MTREEAKAFVESFVQLRDLATDAMALKVPNLYPAFESLCEKAYAAKDIGYKFTYGGELWKTKQANYTFVSHYPPGTGMESLYERIDETHEGTASDPIPYDGNMVLELGKYYTQDGVTYLCTRDIENATHPLAELVGQYVEVA